MLFAIAFIGLVIGALGLAASILTDKDSHWRDVMNTVGLAFCIASLIIVFGYWSAQ